jgi:hypothetical protein
MADLFSALDMTPLPNGKHWRLNKEFPVLSFVVPAGFVTDLASVPRVFWFIAPRWGKHGPAAILHDYLYRTGEVDRRTADNRFADVMDLCNVHPIFADAMFFAVRIFGFHAWARKRRK